MKDLVKKQARQAEQVERRQALREAKKYVRNFDSIDFPKMSPAAPFKSPVNDWVHWLVAKRSDEVIAPLHPTFGLLATTLLEAPILIISHGTPTTVLGIVASGFAGIPLLAGFASTIGYGLYDSFKHKQIRQKLRPVLRTWIHERYGLDINDSLISDELVDFAWVGKGPGEKFAFTDETGKNFNLVALGETRYVEEVSDDMRTDYAPVTGEGVTGTQALETVEAALPGEAGMFYRQVTERLNLLRGITLDEEHQHVVNRAREDLHETVDAWQQLTRIGGGEDQTAIMNLSNTLTVLVAELDGVLAHQRQGLAKRLSIQRQYVETRQVGGKLDLSLTMIQDTTPATGVGQ